MSYLITSISVVSVCDMPRGSSVTWASTQDGGALFAIGQSSDRAGNFSLFDGKRGCYAEISRNKSGASSLQMNKNGKLRAAMGIAVDGDGFVVTADSEDNLSGLLPEKLAQ